ncbi:MAG: DUF938 domain-containing protein [Pseudomonadota bacterium]
MSSNNRGGVGGGSFDLRLRSPSSERNLEPIRLKLTELLGPGPGRLLEIGSGSGYHAAHLSLALPGWSWIASDPDPGHRASIAAWAAHLGADLAEPLPLDMLSDWTAELSQLGFDAVFSANVIHIAPWPVAEGLIDGAAKLLRPGGKLLFYGPFIEGGQHTGAGNARFDASLRAENPGWGLRDTDDVARGAKSKGFGPPVRHLMPSNNRILEFALPG